MINAPQGAGIRYSALVGAALGDRLIFRPAPPGDGSEGCGRLQLPIAVVDVGLSDDEFQTIETALGAGVLTKQELQASLADVDVSDEIASTLCALLAGTPSTGWVSELDTTYQLNRLGLLAVDIVNRAQGALLDVEPLSEVHFKFSAHARLALALGWHAISKRGVFPLLPRGAARFAQLDKAPHGGLHFVSASDLDGGFLYTMGIAQSPEAQALRTMDVTFGLDGELIVPGQAVSPIPPFLALATRLFAASVPTSSNISEEIHAIPIRSFPHPASVDDLEPRRGGRKSRPQYFQTADAIITDLRRQLSSHDRESERRAKEHGDLGLGAAGVQTTPDIGSVFDVSGLHVRRIRDQLKTVLSEPVIKANRELLALYLNVEAIAEGRVERICEVVDAARHLGIRFVAVADDAEDSWLPNLLEYLEPFELNAVADYADAAGVVVTDGRPVDPVYTASTAAQRIQSVFTTLSVDIVKMGMWLCLDALAARSVWLQIIGNPHIPRQMLLMPIGIVEPWNAFVDNRDLDRTPRAILNPFDKIKFMIDEAATLGIPSLLTDTRHKATWVLLGRVSDDDLPHPRERFLTDPVSGEALGRTPESAIPLLSWTEFMACERLARAKGILLGQAGSIEASQLYRVISETTYDAALERRNPATALWTAETERQLPTPLVASSDLQATRSAAVSPFLAVINRGFETHAKLDGWLRYLSDLEEEGKSALRSELERLRQRVVSGVNTVIGAQKSDATHYQAAWDAFRKDYSEYHAALKVNFVEVRQAVQQAWTA